MKVELAFLVLNSESTNLAVFLLSILGASGGTLKLKSYAVLFGLFCDVSTALAALPFKQQVLSLEQQERVVHIYVNHGLVRRAD